MIFGTDFSKIFTLSSKLEKKASLYNYDQLSRYTGEADANIVGNMNNGLLCSGLI